ncbi:MAG: leucine/isoleucine/valine transporter permease subunit, partial [Anaerolineae bacterium]
GLISWSLSAIGFIALLNKREMIARVFTMGHLFLFAAPIALSYLLAQKTISQSRSKTLGFGAVIGVVNTLPLILTIILANAFDIRRFLINVSPELIDILTFHQGAMSGSLVLLLLNVALSVAASALFLLSDKWRVIIGNGLVWVILAGTFSEILLNRLRSFFGTAFTGLIFTGKSLNPGFAVFIAVLGGAYTAFRQRREEEKEQTPNRKTFLNLPQTVINRIVLGLVLLFLPLLLGSYLTEVANNVGLYILMGLGLNIVVGFAGLLDLGYVAFFAIGAYVMGKLTSEGALGLHAGFNFWTALPIAVLAAVAAGIILGIPVLRMRGDYLAIVTLGFGEIIRILALSDMLKPQIGGAQGILQIPKPSIFGIELIQPGQIYYIILIGVLLAWFISSRLRDSRLGRQWMAMREDEDVAEAMGINLVNTKLLAFATGAAFSGLSGAIFAPKLTSIFPHSFNLIVSINVLSLIIVGGIGSLPGVVVGSLILVGLPELLREFAEHRLLMYGILLIFMMLARPEGFWPSEITKRELHAHEQQQHPTSAD